MKDIINCELYNFRKSVTLRVIAGLFLFYDITAFLFVGIIRWLQGIPEVDPLMIADPATGLECFAGYADGILFTIPLAVLVGNIIAGEYSQGIVKQILASGKKRWKVIAGQLISFTAGISILTLVMAAIQSLGMSIFSSPGFSGLDIGRFMLVILGIICNIFIYSSIAMLTAHLTRSAVLAIVLNIGFFLAGNMAIGLVAFILKMQWISDYWITQITQRAISLYIPLRSQVTAIALEIFIGLVFFVMTCLVYSRKNV